MDEDEEGEEDVDMEDGGGRGRGRSGGRRRGGGRGHDYMQEISIIGLKPSSDTLRRATGVQLQYL